MRFTALLLAILLSGCSWIFVTGPPSRSEWARNPHAHCTTSDAAPILDVLFALSEVSGAIYYATSAEDDGGRLGGIIGGIVGAGIFAASAAYGFGNTGRCQEYRFYSYTRGGDR